jgi:transcriptional regulator
MYVPSHFEEANVDILHDLISCHPVGVLVTHGIEGLDANHIPFELDKGEGSFGVLRAHVARANPLWRNVSDGDEALAIFQAGDAYISPNWYPSKHETHKQVPTWNYKVAHAYGRIVVKDDERTVRGIVARLTKSHEVSQPVPWKMSDSPKEFIDTMVKAIVGIEIHVTRLIGKSKLSQNRESRDIRGAALALKSQGDHLIADAMLSCASAKDEL